MTNVTELANLNTRRARVAAEVRGLLAKRRVPISKLPASLGNSREYWRRRVVVADVALSVDDLEQLAGFLNVDIVDFFAGTAPSPLTPAGMKKGPGVESQALSLPDLDSNQEPTGIESAPSWGGRDVVERSVLAPVVAIAGGR
jgi:hypothetical protein